LKHYDSGDFNILHYGNLYEPWEHRSERYDHNDIDFFPNATQQQHISEEDVMQA